MFLFYPLPFASLFRRFFLPLAAVLLLVAGVESAQGANCRLQADQCDQGAAYSEAWKFAKQASAAEARSTPCVLPAGTNAYNGGWIPQGVNCVGPSPIGFRAYLFYFVGLCSSRPSETTPFLPLTGSTSCIGGCIATYAQNADETSRRSYTGGVCGPDFKDKCPSGSFWNGYMGVCQPVDSTCPDGQKKQDGVCVPDGKCPQGMVAVPGATPGAIQQGSLYCKPQVSECPPGNIKSPSGQCLPGDGQCAAGEARGKDGTCKRDSNNDGRPDSEEGEDDPSKDSASGGDSCNAPPSCNGNPIQCVQLKVQWRIDCNTRKNRNISGGSCSAVPICTGDKCDAMEYASLLQQWKSACALEKLAGKTGGDGSGDGECAKGDANCNGVADVLEGSGEATEPGDGAADVEGSKKFGIGVGTDMLDQSNIFGGGSCPQPPTFHLMGATISGADFPYWCQAMAILRGLILIFGAFTALKILMGGVG